MDDGVEAYLTGLAQVEQDDDVLADMEARAAQHRFPIVGRATGRFLELAARAVGARRVLELGSGYGYSAYWFSRAVGPTGEVVCTDSTASNILPAPSTSFAISAACATDCAMLILTLLWLWLSEALRKTWIASAFASIARCAPLTLGAIAL